MSYPKYNDIIKYADYYILDYNLLQQHPLDQLTYEDRLQTVAKICYILMENLRGLPQVDEITLREYVTMILYLFEREREVLLRLYFDKWIYNNLIDKSQITVEQQELFEQEQLSEEDMNICFTIIAYFVNSYLTTLRNNINELENIVDSIEDMLYYKVLNMNDETPITDSYNIGDRVIMCLTAPRYYGILVGILLHIIHIIHSNYAINPDRKDYIKSMENIHESIMDRAYMIVET